MVPRADPLSLPFLGGQEAHLELGDLAVRARVAALSPVTHFPPIRAATLERFAVEGDLRGFLGGPLSRVPLIALPPVEHLRPGRDQDLVRRLPLAALAVFEYPKETRPAHVDAERVRQVFASQVGRSRGAALSVGELD